MLMTTPTFDWNFMSREAIDNPFSAYEQIRATGSIVRNELMQSWMIPGYEDCMKVLTDDGGMFSISMNADPNMVFWFDELNMIQVDGADHSRLRNVLAPLFTK